LIVDVSNPAAPTLKGSYDTAAYSQGVEVEETMHMWLIIIMVLVIVDVSNPQPPL